MAGWHHRLDGHEFESTLGVLMDREACMLRFMGSQRVGTVSDFILGAP